MPTVIILDSSLSMARPVIVPECSEVYNRRRLAIHGINTFLDYLSANFKLEFVALSLVSSTFEPAVAFTRDLEAIKTHLNKVDSYGKTCIEEAFSGVRNLVLEEWGASAMCQILLVTDGRLGIGAHSLKTYIHSLRSSNRTMDEITFSSFPFPFSSKLHVLCIENPTESHLEQSCLLYKRLVELNHGNGQVLVPEGPLSIKSVQQMFSKLCETHYVPFYGTLRCGNLVSHIQLSPPPEPFCKARDFEIVKCTMAPDITICGFLDINDVASPAAYSRHLVLPISTKCGEIPGEGKPESDADDETAISDDGKTPSFCVLLHGSLKVGLMVAVCQLAENWYGMLYSWADSKKKSNLMLSVFEPGFDSIPWLGNIDMLTLAEVKQHSASYNKKTDDGPHFPVKPVEKRSYTQSNVIWIRQSGLQSDIQKIVRNARKLPEKTQIFYKELNRLKRGALAFGFSELLDGVASILMRECTLLPGTAHPDAALQLSHAANFLKSNHSRDYNTYIQPLRTKFTTDDTS